MKRFRLLLFICLCAALPTQAQVLLTPTYTLTIPMRDGKSLAADVYVPNNTDSFSTILIQTPYNKNLFRAGLPIGYRQNLSSSPYAWVVVDWRGFYASAPAAVQQPNRGQDGYDVIEWITQQSWSNGKVGTWGPSALGGIQYQTAKEQHPAHVCAVPLVAHPHTSYDSYYYGGVLEEARLNQLDALGYGLSPIVLNNPYYSNLWQISENNTWYPQLITIPTLQIGGWYDHNIDKMTEWYKATRTQTATAVRNQQWLLVGPWVHGGNGSAYVGSANQGELTYTNAQFTNDTLARRFFEYYLLDSANGWLNTPAITYYQTGENTWANSTANSIEVTAYSQLLLNPGNGLSTQLGTGQSNFVCNPQSPSPTIGGPTLGTGMQQGPYNQVSLETRPDVLTFATTALQNDVTVSGRVKLTLYVEANQPDADIAIRLTDRYPDGRDMLITDGIRRMRFRAGYTQASESFMAAGQVYPVEITLPFTHYTFKAGHHIKIYVSGNNSPRWNVNLQNGGAMYTPGDTNTANIAIHHSAQYPSAVNLPGNNPVLSNTGITPAPSVQLYPNPANNAVYFTTNLPIQQFTVTDATGRTVMEGNYPGHYISVQSLSTGLYGLRLTDTNGTTYTARFVKQ